MTTVSFVVRVTNDRWSVWFRLFENLAKLQGLNPAQYSIEIDNKEPMLPIDKSHSNKQ
jgi:hypothetical protein